MTSPDLADLIKNVDPVDALRLLVADLQVLADRLGLKEHSRSLQQTLKATHERVFGPHAVVMLLAEDAKLKRRFLERLLGSPLTHVPEAVTACTRLEYGSEAECTVIMPQGLTAVLPLEQLTDFLERHSAGMPRQATQAIRLPNTTLARGLCVIDTPALEPGSPMPCVLESAVQTDAWVLVLNADHALNETSQSLIRRLPEGASRLEILVEGAETLRGEERTAARERLMTALREQCGIDEPRITLVASASADGDEGSFWHGRFATFHSVLMLRSRERWLEATRSIVAGTLADVAAEMHFELKSMGLGLRQARLRMGLKELEGLRTRFLELGRLDRERPRETLHQQKASLLSEPTIAAALPAETPSATDASAADLGPPRASAPVTVSEKDPEPGPKTDTTIPSPAPSPSLPKEESKPISASPAVASEAPAVAGMTDSAAGSVPAEPMGEPTFVKFSGPESTGDTVSAPTQRRGISIHLNEDVARLLRPKNRNQTGSQEVADDKTTMPWRIVGAALVAAAVCLVAWMLWPRIRLPAHESAAQWSYQPASAANMSKDATHAVPGDAAGSATTVGMPPPVAASAAPDTAGAETPNAVSPEPATAGTTARIPLPRPTPMLPGNRRKRHHGFLGLGRVWHWIRHPAGGGQPETEH